MMTNLSDIRKRFKQLTCKHDMMPTFDERRIYLSCRYCGKESPGWELPPTGPRPRRDVRRPYRTAASVR